MVTAAAPRAFGVHVEEGDEAGAPLRESYGESVESETSEVRASERAAEGDDRGLSTASAAALV